MSCVLWRGLKTACHHSLMHIDHFLNDVDQWQSHNLVCVFSFARPVWFEIGVDGSIAVLTIAEHVA